MDNIKYYSYEYINYYILKNKIEGISVDLWGTLISDNTAYLKREKNNIYYNYIKDFDERIDLMRHIESVKRDCAFMENEGIVVSGNKKVHQYLNGAKKLKRIDREIIINQLNNLELNSNLILNKELIHWLYHWKMKRIKLSIISNTGTTDAITTRKILAKYKLNYLFDEIILSEEVNFGKPHNDIFYLTIKKMNVRFEKCIHLGDSVYYDYEASNKVGYRKSFLIRMF